MTLMTYLGETYGEKTADLYDTLYEDFAPPPGQLELLASLSGAGPVVEVGAGTGRIAVPLAEKGISVIAVDASPEMTAQLEQKSRNLPIVPITADAADYVAPEPVPLLFAVFNTFFLLAQEDIQRAFLRNAVRTLRPDGVMVLETFAPRPGQRLPDGPHPGVFPVDKDLVLKRQFDDAVLLFSAERHAARGEFHYREVLIRDGQPSRVLPGKMRYWEPEDIDALAKDAGLTLKERRADWDGGPYRPGVSAKHVSLYTPALSR
ncbi:class I SAM-dependent methyltransferase [Streptomyces sp. NPDC051173]|uniref:class I SAM-dependent methyltransferase n=1 Tax=Streptomyces sp. NPDC051173 TaxID=3155164 RepID=UPI00344D33E3